LVLSLLSFTARGARDRAVSLLSVGTVLSKTESAWPVITSNRKQVPDVPRKVPESVRELLCPYAHYQSSLREQVRDMVLDVWPKPNEQNPLVNAKYHELKKRFQRPRRCAVVSSSGVMLDHEYGKQIDSSDLVFRFNDAEIGGELQKSVGSRDDVRIINHQSFSNLITQREARTDMTAYLLTRQNPRNTTEIDMVRQISKEHPLVRCSFATRGRKLLEHVPRQMLIDKFATSEEMKKELNTTAVLTTGFKGVMIAMTICDEVYAYGFPDTPAGEHAPFHYYGLLKRGTANKNEDPAHALTAEHEKALYKMMAMNTDVDTSDVAVLPGFGSLKC